MKRTKLKLRKGRVITASIIIIVGLIFFFCCPTVRAIVIALMLMACCIIAFLKEWKAILLILGLVLSFNLFDNSVINTVALGFFFNIVFINLSFNPSWNRQKHEIKQYIDENKLHSTVKFNEAFFERVKDREKALYTMFFYAMSILPSITLNILLKNKAFLFEHFPLIKQIYSFALSILKLNGNSPYLLKCIAISMVLIVFYMILMFVIILTVKESSLTLKEINEKRNRDTSYWNENNLDIDENEIIYLDVVKNSSQNQLKAITSAKEILKGMEQLGIKTVDEYIKYIDSQRELLNN